MRVVVNILIFSIFCLLSCGKSGKQKVEASFDKLWKKEFIIPNLNDAVYLGRDTIINRMDYKANKIVIYYDSTDCTSCEVSELWRWKAMIKDFNSHDVSFVFILAPSKKHEDEVRDYLYLYPLPFPVFIDASYVVSQSNSQLLSEKYFNVFMLNEDNEVILIGNPIKNNELYKLYEEVINSF